MLHACMHGACSAGLFGWLGLARPLSGALFTFCQNSIFLSQQSAGTVFFSHACLFRACWSSLCIGVLCFCIVSGCGVWLIMQGFWNQMIFLENSMYHVSMLAHITKIIHKGLTMHSIPTEITWCSFLKPQVVFLFFFWEELLCLAADPRPSEDVKWIECLQMLQQLTYILKKKPVF